MVAEEVQHVGAAAAAADRTVSARVIAHLVGHSYEPALLRHPNFGIEKIATIAATPIVR